jgi:hypothetical protein
VVGISLEHLGGRVHHSFGIGHKWHTADTTWSRNKIGTSTGTIPCSELFEEVASRKGLRLENYGAQVLAGRRLDRNGGEGNREAQLHQSMVAVALTIGFLGAFRGEENSKVN